MSRPRDDDSGKRRGDAGMIGKLLAVWLILLAVLIVAAIDTSSIVFANLHTSQLATDAASAAATSFRDTADASLACKAATDSIHSADASATLAQRGGCKVNPTTGAVKITVIKHVNTLVAGRLGITKKYVTITDSVTATGL